MRCCTSFAILTLLICGGFSDTQLSRNLILEPYDLLFDNAVEAYHKADWMSVILNMERAIHNKGTLRRVRAHCRLTCANQTSFGETAPGLGLPIPGIGSIEDLGFFQTVLKRADCVNSCENEKLGPPTLHKVSEEVQLEFRKRTPYNYLQVAYFKINKLDKAVSAAYTFYIANPDHLEMRQNLEYYRMMAGVQETDFKDLESRLHMAEFLDGKRFYSADEFAPSIDPFEAAVDEYFTADQECRALCEGAYDYDGYNYMEYSADLFQSITDHYIHVLNCKQNCVVELASTAGREKPFEDFLPSHFNYLQFSYYNSEKYEKAIECAKTYLLFHPEDEVMNQNLAYYSAVLGEERAATISAREVVQQYIKKSLLEKELLYFGYEIFGIAFVDPETWTPVDVMPLKLREKQKTDRETAARITEEIGNLMKEIETLVEEKSKDSTDIAKMVKDGAPADSNTIPPSADSFLFDNIKVTMTSKLLNGSQRVVLDGVISDDECRELHHLSNAAALKGDGYRGGPSPHSPSEMFQGITVLKALKLGQDGMVPLKSARLFFDLSEKVRKVLESYFSLESTLYFSYTHLVCRSAIDEKQDNREDLSHPVHADNCLLVSELNECVKEPPAYTHRDYSAILYLNDDFEGGDFIFTELDAKTVTAVVRPQCGRVVGFGAGKENPHGVKAVTKGQRCAVALWFTLDPRHDEKERIQADALLKMLSTPVDAEFQRTGTHSSAETASQPESTEPANKQEQDGVEKTAGEQTDKPAEEQTDKPAGEQTDKPAGEQTDKPAGEQTDKPAGEQTDKPAEEQTDKPAGEQPDKPAGEQTDKPAEELTDKPADDQADKPAGEQTDKPAGEQTDKPAGEQTDKPAGEQTDKPADDQADKPAGEQTDKPAGEQTDKPAEEQTDKPAGEQTDKPAGEQTDKPAEELTDKPADDQADKPAGEQTDKPAGEQTDKPADDQADKPSDKKTESENVKKEDKPKVKDTGNTKVKAGSKTGDKTKAKQADKTKVKQANKTKAKQVDKKEKPVTKKAVKATAKKTAGVKSSSDSGAGTKQPKAKSSDPKQAKAGSSSALDSQTDREEL